MGVTLKCLPPHSCFYSCCVLDIHIVLKVLSVYIYLMKNDFCFVIMLFFFLVLFVWSCSFCGKLILMLFIFYLIRKCNLIWRWWSGCVCVRECVFWCVSSAWISEQETCVDRVIENERLRVSLCSFFSLSPSLLPEGQGLNPNVSSNELIVSFFLLTMTRRATCFVTKHPKPFKPAVFKRSL